VSPLPIADHGTLVAAIPFVVPMLVIVVGLVTIMVRDRRQQSPRTSQSPRNRGVSPPSAQRQHE
jgi:choline-glycine betaine transporter